MYAFDHRLDAKSVIKERFVWMLYMGIFFFLLYGTANQYAGLNAPHPSVVMSWEKQIPFIPAFIIPYMSSDVMFVIAFFFPYTRQQLRILAARILFIITISCIVFLLFPLQFSFVKPPTESFSVLFDMLKADLPFNQLPSLHVAFAVVLWFSMRNYLRGLWKFLTAFWLWLIVLSTLFVYQHHVIDLPAGALLGLLAVYIIREDEESILTHSFTTPRSLKMALYYIAVSALFMIVSFQLPAPWSIVFVWFAISMLLVSVIYAFGLNTLLAGKDAQASWWQWSIFAPYYLGNYLSWHYYKRKIPLMQPLKENVYIGRYPSVKEYRVLQHTGITKVINLATEQQIQKKRLPQIRLPYLDQTIQSPQLLHQGVLAIEACKKEGVYVHCALGMSRTVLLASAWLLYRGYSLEAAQRVMRTVKPMQVRSPYMQITLEIYQEYLDKTYRK